MSITTYRGFGGIKLTAEVRGSVEDPAILLVHGAGQTRSVWGTIWSRLRLQSRLGGLVLAVMVASCFFTLPWTLGREVSDDPRYFNSQLAANPWSRWREPPP